MPRTARAAAGGYCYHVLNRGNDRTPVFERERDYEIFVELLGEASQRVPVRVLAYCLLPTHFHLVVWPGHDGDLGRWMQWLMTTQVRRYHEFYRGRGHVWQGRYRSFPIEPGEHLLAVLRYVERNPARASLVPRPEEWPWCSLGARPAPPPWLAPGPTERPRDWLKRVNRPEADAELAPLRRSVERGTPYGAPAWTQRTAARLGLESTMRPRGRPRKVLPKGDSPAAVRS